MLASTCLFMKSVRRLCCQNCIHNETRAADGFTFWALLSSYFFFESRNLTTKKELQPRVLSPIRRKKNLVAETGSHSLPRGENRRHLTILKNKTRILGRPSRIPFDFLAPREHSFKLVALSKKGKAAQTFQLSFHPINFVLIFIGRSPPNWSGKVESHAHIFANNRFHFSPPRLDLLKSRPRPESRITPPFFWTGQEKRRKKAFSTL